MLLVNVNKLLDSARSDHCVFYGFCYGLFFKKLKQNVQLHYFYSELENGIKTQIWSTIIAQLLLMVLKIKSKTQKVFLTVVALVSI